MNKNVSANLAAAVAALCAGTSVVVTRLAVGEIDPIALAFYRYIVAAVCLVPLLPFLWPLSPITAILLAGVMLGEAVTPVLIVGLIFVIAGIFVANWRGTDKGVLVKTGLFISVERACGCQTNRCLFA